MLPKGEGQRLLASLLCGRFKLLSIAVPVAGMQLRWDKELYMTLLDPETVGIWRLFTLGGRARGTHFSVSKVGPAEIQ